MNHKHLTYDDRLAIQAGLQQGLKVAQIAKNIGKDRSTVGREIKAHRRLVSTSKGNNCIHHCTCMFFASTFSSKMQIEFLKVAWGISPLLHFLRRHSFGCRRGAVAGIQSLLVTDM